MVYLIILTFIIYQYIIDNTMTNMYKYLQKTLFIRFIYVDEELFRPTDIARKS